MERLAALSKEGAHLQFVNYNDDLSEHLQSLVTSLDHGVEFESASD